jgi:ubiquinone/menaquinone biosynthesis C-methylase UbiE
MASAADKKLLPASISDFRTPEFWKGFFETRGGKAFEWYGSWDHFGGNILSVINTSPLLPSTAASSPSVGYTIGSSASSNLKLSDLKVLVLGCGNSDMSFEMHAAGLTNITNVDFDKGVIDEMRAKGEKRGQAMRWEVMDVTNMATFGTKSFHVVVDKGTLDAMMTDTSTGTTESVSKMFSEVERVLVPNGLYLTITLAQDHLVSHYLTSLVSAERKVGVPSWASIRLEPFRKLDYSSRALQFVCVAQKSDGKATSTAVSARIPETFEPIFDAPDAKKGKKRGGAKASGADIPPQPFEDRPLPGTPAELVAGVLQAINEMGWGFQLFKQVSSMMPNQYTQFDIWRMPRPDDKASNPWAMMVSPYGALPHTTNTAAIDGVAPRYSVSMVDISLAYSAAIVLVPQGREHEWAFGTKEGQFDLARSAMKYGRVFFVYLNRGHVFESQRIVQVSRA